jgi:CheY-like chemotaxis protein
VLAKRGHASVLVGNGKEALALASSEKFDLILMDVQMPEVDGLAASRTIRASEIDTGVHTTIIALTANALDRDRRACLDAGMDDYLSKPLELDALRAALDRWLPIVAVAS